MYVWCLSSSHSVFKSARPGRYDSSSLSLHTARGAFAAGQIVLREHADFTITGVEFSGFSAPFICAFENLSYRYQDFITYNDGTPYPDPLSDAEACEVKAECAQSIWIFADIPQDGIAGLCTFTATVNTTLGSFDVPCSLRVYGATVPTPDKGRFNLEYFLNFSPECCGERWSEKWYAFTDSYAKSLSYLRNNCLDVQILPLLSDGGSHRISETEWKLDFTYVGKYIELMLSYGFVKKISIRSVIAVVMGDTIPVFGYDGKLSGEKYNTPVADAFAAAYYGGIYNYFSEKGWVSMLQMRLQDEPHYTECWRWAREICRKNAPGVICGEPLDEHSSGLGLEGYCDQFIPRINVYEEGADYYRRMQAKGYEVWVYSCCFPEEEWFLNKFIDKPFMQSRIMSWGCFSQGITGFLHWGYNYWSDTSLYGTAPGSRFKGDGFLVYYDGEKNRITYSTRYIQTVLGAVDYELFKAVSDISPERALAISRSVCRTFADFESNPDALDKASHELLCAAEEVSVK